MIKSKKMEYRLSKFELNLEPRTSISTECLKIARSVVTQSSMINPFFAKCLKIAESAVTQCSLIKLFCTDCISKLRYKLQIFKRHKCFVQNACYSQISQIEKKLLKFILNKKNTIIFF